MSLPQLTFERDMEGDFVGLVDGGEVPWEGAEGEMLGDLLGLFDCEVEGDCKEGLNVTSLMMQIKNE